MICFDHIHGHLTRPAHKFGRYLIYYTPSVVCKNLHNSIALLLTTLVHLFSKLPFLTYVAGLDVGTGPGRTLRLSPKSNGDPEEDNFA